MHMQVAHGATILVVALAYISISRHVKEATSAAVSSNMYASLDHVAIGMQAILAANHSAFVVADYLAATSNMNRLSRVSALILLCLFFWQYACMTNVDALSFPNTIL
jgi:hypothetical protein